MSKSVTFLSILLVIICLGASAFANDKRVLKIYLDSDRSNHIESAYSIEMGIKTAFSEVNNEVQGFRIEYVIKNHQGNSVRSKLHMQQFMKDPDALFILAGLHSPPLIKYRKYVNENKILTLVPWAAGGPITRYPSKDNWVFRLSLDDTKAGIRMADFAIRKLGCKSPHLLLEKTPWGISNEKNMKIAFRKLLGIDAPVMWFNWNVKDGGARIKLRNVVNQGTDCIMFVGNAIEGAKFSRAMLSLNKNVPIVSHWGITGGNFHKKVDAAMRRKLKLFFIQSCFSFISSASNDFTEGVFRQIQSLYPEVKEKKNIPAPTGFIHAYDIGKLVIAAMKQIRLTPNMEDNRNKLRLALENLQNPVQGLIKEYRKPFSQYSAENRDAHEALGLRDFCMGRFGDSDEVIVMRNMPE